MCLSRVHAWPTKVHTFVHYGRSYELSRNLHTPSSVAPHLALPLLLRFLHQQSCAVEMRDAMCDVMFEAIFEAMCNAM
jgi:hypothetical protein